MYNEVHLIKKGHENVRQSHTKLLTREKGSVVG